MSRFGNKAYAIDRPDPSDILLKARMLAMRSINEQMREYPEFSKDGRQEMRWIKTDLTYPSFEHFTFGYKNQVYPVFVELIEHGTSLMASNEIERFLIAAQKYNFVPCVFKVNIDNELCPISDGWNLWDLRDGKSLNPITLASDKRVRMSEWELSDFAIQIVRDYLKKKNLKISSYCSLPEVNPQIWFIDKQNRDCWLVVKHIVDISDDDYHKWIGLENNSQALTHYDGYFAGVSFTSLEPFLCDEEGNLIPPSERGSGKEPLYRGDKMAARFTGIKRVFVSSL